MKCNKGQALIEGLMVSVIVIPLFFVLLAGLYLVCADAAADEFLEMHLQCVLTPNPICYQHTHRRLSNLGLQIQSLHESNNQAEHSISLEASFMKKWHLKKKRILFYETRIKEL